MTRAGIHAIVRRARGHGNHKDVWNVIERYIGNIYKTAHKAIRTGTNEELNELVHRGIIAVDEAIRSFRFSTKVPFTSYVNRAINNAIRQSVEDSAVFTNETGTLEWLYGQRVSPEQSPMKVAEGNELWRIAAEVLTPRQFQLIRLRFKEGMSHKEIGEMFGVTKQAIQNNESKALRKLRQAIKGR